MNIALQDFLFSKLKPKKMPGNAGVKLEIEGLKFVKSQGCKIWKTIEPHSKSIAPIVINQKVKKHSTQIVTISQRDSLKELDLSRIEEKFIILKGINLIKLLIRPS